MDLNAIPEMQLRTCKYRISESSHKEYMNKFEFNSVLSNNEMTRLSYADIDAVFSNRFGSNNTELNFEGPSLHSECKIYDIDSASYQREFGYIQTSKIFYQKTIDNVIVYIDFQSNLLSNQKEILDNNGEISPFYSQASYFILPADAMPIKNTIKLKFDDYPSSKTNLYFIEGDVQQVERHQIFYIYIVMRYLRYDGQFHYEILHTFEWFLYYKWINKKSDKNYNYEYNYGVNCHEDPHNLPNINIFETCNNDQLEYLIDLVTGEFKIINYPIISINLSDEETYRQKIQNAVITRNNREREQEIRNIFQ